jgi:hypothetical protein
LREKHRLKLFGNGLLRKIFGLRRDEGAWDWRSLHNAELKIFTPHQILFG